jgi:hypothetical protein
MGCVRSEEMRGALVLRWMSRRRRSLERGGKDKGGGGRGFECARGQRAHRQGAGRTGEVAGSCLASHMGWVLTLCLRGNRMRRSDAQRRWNAVRQALNQPFLLLFFHLAS